MRIETCYVISVVYLTYLSNTYLQYIWTVKYFVLFFTVNKFLGLLQIYPFSFLTVVHQAYEAEADNEYVIKGNSAIMKCEIPSFVADFVSVTHWIDSLGKNYYPDRDYGTDIVLRVNSIPIWRILFILHSVLSIWSSSTQTIFF